ncbi:MAG: sialate O-acetylesterase [Planctomycetia bacterium]|nr:sialate O-acetylesterase [Planctomycetia bacterium]
MSFVSLRKYLPTLGLGWACCLSLVAPARADVSLPEIIGSNMVLQSGVPVTVWGWADPEEEVAVSVGDNSAKTKADAGGEWRVQLKPIASADAVEMTVQGKNTLKLTNILVGEVWVGSGQSNMQWSVKSSQDPDKEIADAKFPKIRLFLVPLVPSGTPAQHVNAQWVECSPETVSSFSAVLYYFGRHLHRELNVPVGLIATSWGGTRIEPWIPPVGFESEPELTSQLEQIKATNAVYNKQMLSQVKLLKQWLAAAETAGAGGKTMPSFPSVPNHPLNSNGAATGLYNGMIHPIVPFAARGAIWYQGESNNGMGMKYHTLMKGLIAGWRSVWNNPDLAFYFVQLAPYNYGKNNETNLAGIWEAQTATLAVPHTGMAVTTDIGNVADIHPKNKQEVGRRLALWALAQDYGKKDLVYSGPLYDSHTIDIDQVKIKFKHTGTGLKSLDGKSLTWFTIAGADKKFVPATAKIEGDSVLVSSSKVFTPVAVRFGFNQLAEPNLGNKEGLPASPFRTDTWDIEPKGP